MAKKENINNQSQEGSSLGEPNRGFPWVFIILAVFLIGGVLLVNRSWVSQQWESLVEITQPQPEEESSEVESPIEETLESAEEESLIVVESYEEPVPTLEELYQELDGPQTYSIYQYDGNGSIEDLHVRRAFTVLTDRLKKDGNFYSTVEYMIKVYPTLDDNISILEVSERYADREIPRGHYRFDYRAHEVTKY